MALVSRPIPSLLNGVSQQPPSLRKASQCERLINGYPNLVDGLTKRPPSYYVDTISASSLGAVLTYPLNFGGTDQFIMVLEDGDVSVYATDGTPMTMSFSVSKTYLDVSNPITDFGVVAVEDVIYIVNKTVIVDYDTPTAGGTYQGEVQTFGSLPTSGLSDGDVYRIVGDDTVVLTGYYVKWDATASTWKECPYPGIETTLDGALMPHKLTWNGTTTFTFDEETWTPRAAGSLTSLPEPNFVARAIRDVFFYRNRLGFLAGEYCVLSQSGPDYQNFFRQSATDILDNDFIDVRAANVKVSTLDSAIQLNKQLLMLNRSTQFVMGTADGQLLTPTTAAIDVATNYAANSVAKPVTVGNSVYFPSENALFSALREYTVSNDSQVANSAEDITAHIPSYIPAGVFRIAVAENDNVLFLLTTGDQTRVYINNYFWLNEEKVQNAWGYWQFDSADTILSMDIFGSSLFLLIERADGVHLERIDLKDDPTLTDMGFVCHLDHRVKVSGVYDGGADETTWTLPYEHSPFTEVQVVKCEDWTTSYGALIATPTLSGTNDVVASGDYSDYDVYIGVPYTFTYRFSELFVRDSNKPDEGSPILNAVLHLRTMNIRFNETGFLRAEVTPRTGATTYQYSFNGMVLDTADLVIGTPNITTGTFRFPVVADSQRAVIDLVNDSHMPSAIVSAEWSGNFTPKAGRR